VIPEDHQEEENKVKCDDSDDDEETDDQEGLQDAVASETLPIRG
jgi:hypothetical protein